jgi:hypothetical protein
VTWVEPILPYALSYAAGAMIWVSEGITFLSFLFGVALDVCCEYLTNCGYVHKVVADELIPEAHQVHFCDLNKIDSSHYLIPLRPLHQVSEMHHLNLAFFTGAK